MTGLSSGTSLGLQLNGQQPMTVSSNGGFSFSAGLATGDSYQVAIATQPAGETCTVTNGTGTVGTTNVTNVAVACSPNPTITYSIGGTVSGLNGSVVLQHDGGFALSVSANGAFAFPGKVVDQVSAITLAEGESWRFDQAR